MRQPLALLLTVLVVLTNGAGSALAEESTRLWVQLPRAATIEGAAEFPFPPEPTDVALERRDRRGRPDRVAVLERGPALDALRVVRATGARIRHVSRWFSAVSVDADAAARSRLVARFGESAVRPVARLVSPPRVEPGEIAPLRSVPDPEYGLSGLQIRQIGLDRLHARGLTGTNVRVLVLDSGFRVEHPALASTRIEIVRDFVNGDDDVGNDPGELGTQDRHGTGVLGVMAGRIAGDLAGGAPDATYLLAKTEVVATETRVEEDNFVAALEWGEALGADVLNASLGYRIFYDDPDGFEYEPADFDGDTAVTTRAIDDLVALGVVAVTAAGNRGGYGTESLLTPADSDSGLAAAAVDSNGIVAFFSSRGPTADGRIKPDLAALGVRVRWADTQDSIGTGWASGTSVASPLVASAAALLLQAHPAWGPGQIAAALRSTASQSSSPDNALGWGVIDAEAATFDVESPIVPLPFGLVAPAAGANIPADGSTFAWCPAEDLQTPELVEHRVEFGTVEDFQVATLVFDAGGDSTRSIDLPVSGTWWWRVVASDPDGNTRASATRRVEVDGATDVSASDVSPWARWREPWPNPATGTTAVRLALDRPARIVSVDVYDAAGRRVRRLREGLDLVAGEWRFGWDGTDDAGRRTGSGAYFLKAIVQGRTGGRIEAKTRFTRLR